MSWGGHNKLTIQDVNNRLSDRNIVLMENYVNARTKTVFMHVSCGRTWKAFPSRVLQGSSCPHCSKHFPLTREIINKRLIDDHRDIIMLDEYVNIRTKSLFKHQTCGYEWLAVPHSIINRKGCPKCSRHGYNSSKSGWAYILKFDNYIKFGITNSLKDRLSQHRKNGNFDLIYSSFFEDGTVPLKWENKIKFLYGGNYVTREICPDGWTETLPLLLISQIIEK